MPEETELYQFEKLDDPAQAVLTVDTSVLSSHAVSPLLYGKFCEHLGSNIYNGMDAQILRNPTFGKWFFAGGTDFANGGALPGADESRVAEAARRGRRKLGWPEPDAIAESYMDGGAFLWLRLGAGGQVRLSPDVDRQGGRAQRLEVTQASPDAPCGIMQWAYLPLHRTRGYRYRLVARAVRPVELTLSLAARVEGSEAGPAQATAPLPLTEDWATLAGRELRQRLPLAAWCRPRGRTPHRPQLRLGRAGV